MRGMPLAPLHPAANYVSGVAEFTLGAALALSPLLGAHADVPARALFWLVVAMSPANVNMWVNDVPFGKERLTYGWTGTHALRCLAQVLLLLWLWGLGCWWRSGAAEGGAAAMKTQ